MSSRSRSPPLLPPSGLNGKPQRESLLPKPKDVDVSSIVDPNSQWNRAGAFVSVGGVRYGVRLSSAKYSGGAGRALVACCGQSRAACCRGRRPAASTTPPPAPTPAALDRLQRFRLGGRAASADRPRSHKAERLRELTERLMGRAPPLDAPTPPPPLPPPRHHRLSKTPPVCADPAPSYAHRTVPFRSASFSQVDFDAIDGKYTRQRIRQCESDQKDLSSTPSVDSAVGSDEGVPLGRDKHSGTRSLTHPLPGRSPGADPELYEGRKSLQHIPESETLRETREESDPSLADSARAHSDAASPTEDALERLCPFEFPLPVEQKNRAGCGEPEIDASIETVDDESFETLAPIPVPVYECSVRVWSGEPPKRRSCGDTEDRSPEVSEGPDDETITSEQVENLLATVQNPSRPPPPPSEERRRISDKSKRRKGIYIAKWPIRDETGGSILPESVDALDFEATPASSDSSAPRRDGLDAAFVWNAPQDESLSPDGEDCAAVPWPKPLTRPRWDSRPALVYQSSEEKEDFGPAKLCDGKCRPIVRTDSLSEGESEAGGPSTPIRDRTASPSPFNPSDFSDGESRCRKERCSHVPRRYSKRPLRGPYGQMLEAEMKKPEVGKLSKHDEELKFLDELVAAPPQRSISPNVSSSRTSLNSTTSSVGASEPRCAVTRTRGAGNLSLDDTQLKSSFGLGLGDPKSVIRSSPKRKVSANIPYSAPNPATSASDAVNKVTVFHQRTTSSPSKLEGFASRQSGEPKRKPEASAELLAELLRGSSERISTDASLDGVPFNVQRFKDTRTHVVVELYDTERSYVEALQILVLKYLQPLKSPENVGLVDAALVDEIFYQVPAILTLHEVFLDELRRRLETWDVKQKVGDVFINVFAKPSVMETYTSFINNWKKAKETIKATSAARPAFARFLEAMAREHKGKLSLDNLLIKPVQKFPRYELLIQRLIKHTEPSHPDHQMLIEAQKEIHELLLKINCTERESLELEQQQQILKELESIVEGLANLVSTERSFLRHDTVSMPSGAGATKERALFLFSDLLLITSIKRRTGTIRKPSALSCPGSLASTLEANKYKLLMRISLDDLEILKAKDENLRRIMSEMETLTEDVNTLTQIAELAANLHGGRAALEDLVREMITSLERQLSERQSSDAQLSCLDLSLNTSNGIENLSVIFSKPEKRTSWEEIFNETKQKMALSDDKRPAPEFISSVPIRKTRAGLQFTCAAPTLAIGPNLTRDVWVCNSDGYVGQVCVLTLQPEPQVTSCNGVCNARILCVACIPPPPPNKISSSEITLTTLNRQNFSNSKAGISISIQDTDEGSQNIRLESSSSSDEDEEGSSAENLNDNNTSAPNQNNSQIQTSIPKFTGTPSPKQSIDETNNCNQPTMWLGTEDGCIHVYNCSDNIRIKKNKVKIQHASGVHCIVYYENKVFVSLANGDIVVYVRDNGTWNEHMNLSVGSVSSPVTKLLLSGGKLWCAQHTHIKIINPSSVQVEETFQVSGDPSKPISHMAISGLGIWVALHNTAILKCYHANTKEMLTELNIAPAVTKMLAGCDDIIRQHKAACLRVTSLMACKELLWVGTSAGVLLTAPASPPRPPTPPILCGIPQGHTGHVRFLTVVESTTSTEATLSVGSNKKQSNIRRSIHSPNKPKSSNDTNSSAQLLVISGGDGYEDFRNASVSEIAGREDSTNHLLLWRV